MATLKPVLVTFARNVIPLPMRMHASGFLFRTHEPADGIFCMMTTVTVTASNCPKTNTNHLFNDCTAIQLFVSNKACAFLNIKCSV